MAAIERDVHVCPQATRTVKRAILARKPDILRRSVDRTGPAGTGNGMLALIH